MNIKTQIMELHASGMSRTKAAKHIGVPKEKFDAMLDILKIEWKPRIRGGNIEINGVKDTLENHAKRQGISPHALRYRLAKDKPLNDPAPAKQVTQQEAERFYLLRKEGVPAWDAANQVGRPYQTLRIAAKRLFPDYESVVKAAPRIRRRPEEMQCSPFSEVA